MLRRWWKRQDEELWLGLAVGVPSFVWVFGGPIAVAVWGEPGWNWQNALIVGPWATMGVCILVGGVASLAWALGYLAYNFFCRGGWRSIT